MKKISCKVSVEKCCRYSTQLKCDKAVYMLFVEKGRNCNLGIEVTKKEFDYLVEFID